MWKNLDIGKNLVHLKDAIGEGVKEFSQSLESNISVGGGCLWFAGKHGNGLIHYWRTKRTCTRRRGGKPWHSPGLTGPLASLTASSQTLRLMQGMLCASSAIWSAHSIYPSLHLSTLQCGWHPGKPFSCQWQCGCKHEAAALVQFPGVCWQFCQGRALQPYALEIQSTAWGR